MLIRPARPADVSAVLPMVRVLCDQHRAWDAARYDYLPDVVDRYARWLPARALDPRSVFLVAETRERDRVALTGFLVAIIEPNIPVYSTTEYAMIHDVWVQPEHRRAGVARALTLTAIDRFRAKSVTQVRLETAALNEPARRLFASCGLRVASIEMIRDL
jgi:ribosomal protein S18 acetylase RimI-like enzyme